MDPVEILDKLRELDRRDSAREYFGAKVHQYKLRPVAIERDITELESKHGLRVPSEYREFVIEVGNGGAGPKYGLYPLGYEHDLRSLAPWDLEGLGDLSRPFPHEEAWNLPSEFWAQQPDPPEDMPAEEEDKLMEQWDAKIIEQYWLPSLVDGAIPISDLGCALSHILVVTGQGAGTVWEDLRADYEGIRPLFDSDGSPLTFGRWYMSWLDQGLSTFSRSD